MQCPSIESNVDTEKLTRTEDRIESSLLEVQQIQDDLRYLDQSLGALIRRHGFILLHSVLFSRSTKFEFATGDEKLPF